MTGVVVRARRADRQRDRLDELRRALAVADGALVARGYAELAKRAGVGRTLRR